MDKLKKNIFIYILLVINFYILPTLIKDTGTAMIMLLVVIPMITLFISVYYVAITIDARYLSFSANGCTREAFESEVIR